MVGVVDQTGGIIACTEIKLIGETVAAPNISEELFSRTRKYKENEYAKSY